MRNRALLVAAALILAACGGDATPDTTAAVGTTTTVTIAPGTSSTTTTATDTPTTTGAAATTTPPPTEPLDTRSLDGLPLHPPPAYPPPLQRYEGLFAVHEATPYCALFRVVPPPGDDGPPLSVTVCRDMTALPQQVSVAAVAEGDDPVRRVHDLYRGEAGSDVTERWFCAIARPGDTERSCDVETAEGDLLLHSRFGPTVAATGTASDDAPPGFVGVPLTVTADGAELIAGRPASCWLLDAGPGGALRQCLDDEIGLLVRSQMRAATATAWLTLSELMSIAPPDPGSFEPSGTLVEGIFFSEI